MNYFKSLPINKEGMKQNIIVGIVVFGLFLLMLSGTTGCLTATFLFGGIIAMAYLS